MNRTVYGPAIIATTLIAGSALAGVDDDDVLYGTGRFTYDTLSPSQGVPFDSRAAIRMGQQGNDSDILYGKRDVRATKSEPYDPLMYDRDDRDDHLHRRSWNLTF